MRSRTAPLLVVIVAAIGLTATALGQAQRAKRPSLTATLSLSSARVAPGARVSGRLVLENRTRAPKVVLRGCAIDGLYGIGLRAADGYLQEPAFAAVGCSRTQPIVATPGRTVIRFTIRASYTACSQGTRHRPPPRSKYWDPLCLEDSSGTRDVMPPLPAGSYTALFFPDGRWLGPAVKPATLVVTKAR